MSMAVGGHFLLPRPPDILTCMQMTSDLATYMYHTVIDHSTGPEVYVAKYLRDRKLHRALLQFFKPENDFEVRQAMLAKARSDLIGGGCDCRIPRSRPRRSSRPGWPRPGMMADRGP